MSSQFKYLINFKLSNDISTKLINYAFKKMISKDLDKINRKLYMSEAEIKKLGYDDLIGSHSYRHLKLSSMKDDELDKEISYSSLIIKNIVEKSHILLAIHMGVLIRLIVELLNCLKTMDMNGVLRWKER